MEQPDFFICKLLPIILQSSKIEIVIIDAYFNIELNKTVFSTAKTVTGIMIISIIKMDINADIIIKNDILNNEEFLFNNILALFLIVSIIFFDFSHFNKCFP